MTKMSISQKIQFFSQNSAKKIILNKRAFGALNLIPAFLSANIIVKLMAPAFQNTLTFNPDIINYGRFGFLKLDNAVSLQPKKTFFTVS